MTRRSIWEYLEAIRGRYLRAGKKEKEKILDEAVQVTGYHPELVRVLRRHGDWTLPVEVEALEVVLPTREAQEARRRARMPIKGGSGGSIMADAACCVGELKG